jgi:hypothetical protein
VKVFTFYYSVVYPMVVDEEDGLGYEYAKLGLEYSQNFEVLRREKLVAVLTSHLNTNP